MSFTNTTTACEYKIRCLEIASNAGLIPERQIDHAKAMYAWVIIDYEKKKEAE